MKTNIIAIIPVLLLFFTFSCNKENSITSRECTIGFGQENNCSFDDLSIRFQGIKESRCPTGATCVWEGEVIVDLLINDQVSTLALTTGEPLLAFDTIGNFIIELKDVLPFPELDVVVPEEDILIEIEVTN